MTGELSSRPSPPALCNSSLGVIDLNTPRERRLYIDFVGFNLDINRDSIQTFLVTGTGVSVLLPGQLNYQGLFAMVLTIPSGLSDQVLGQYKYISIKFNGKSIYEIPILSKIEKPKQTRQTQSGAILAYVIPRHIYGDREFYGHGPYGHVLVQFTLLREKLVAKLYMYGRETTPDWTTVSGYGAEYTLYQSRPGYYIKQVSLPGFTLTPSNGTKVYRYDFKDTNGAIDNAPYNTPVGRITIVGDTYGEEAGSRTKADISFARFSLIEEEK